MSTYNGHPSRRLWNMALWIANDEGLYRLALDCIRHTRTRRAAAEAFVETVNAGGITATPDGTRYTVSAVQYGMRGLT